VRCVKGSSTKTETLAKLMGGGGENDGGGGARCGPGEVMCGATMRGWGGGGMQGLHAHIR
jgi:hypothetical protein